MRIVEDLFSGNGGFSNGPSRERAGKQQANPTAELPMIRISGTLSLKSSIVRGNSIAREGGWRFARQATELGFGLDRGHA